MLSKKVLTMKFMTNSSGDSSNDHHHHQNDASDNYWRLDFKQTPHPSPPPPLQSNTVADAPPDHAPISNGRRDFRRRPAPDPADDEGEGKREEEEDESPEDAFVRRKAEKELDSTSISRMKQASRLSHATMTNNHRGTKKGDARQKAGLMKDGGARGGGVSKKKSKKRKA